VIRVLVVDDSPSVRRLFGRILSAEPDIEIAYASNGVEALDRMARFLPDVVTLDLDMPEMSGFSFLDRIMLERPCPTVMVSSLTEHGAESTLDALHRGAIDFVLKPDGALSLYIDSFAPELLRKIRSAANAKLKAKRSIGERVRPRIAATARLQPVSTKGTLISRNLTPDSGDGLVLVGVSTGGLHALEALLAPLPPTFAWPILVAQHMPASFTGPLARRLDALCGIRVVEVVRPMPLKAGYAYIGRGDADLIVSMLGKRIGVKLVPARIGYPWHPRIDRLVESAMEQERMLAAQMVGILMTGMGDDGAKQMARLRMFGGKTIAESKETAVVWEMPGKLAEADDADWILPLEDIAQQLQRLTPADFSHP
jgi:two-component system, chemotaxis family, protein-glutamate methylesterase/glutaminase